MWIFHRNGIIKYVASCGLASFTSHQGFEVHHVVASIRASFLFMVEFYSPVWIHHYLFTHSFLDEHLGCFHLLAFVNSASIVCLQVSFEYLFSILLSIYLGAGSYGNSILFEEMPKCFSQHCTI